MLTEEQIREAHDFLCRVLMGQTPIRFNKLKKGESNPIQMIAEVLGFVLGNPNGRGVKEAIENMKKNIEDFEKQHGQQQPTAHEAEQARIMQMIDDGYKNDSNGAA